MKKASKQKRKLAARVEAYQKMLNERGSAANNMPGAFHKPGSTKK